MGNLDYTGIRKEHYGDYVEPVSKFYTNPNYFIDKAYRASSTDVTYVVAPEYNIRLISYTKDLSEQQIAVMINNLMQDMFDAQQVNIAAAYSFMPNYDPTLNKDQADYEVHPKAKFVGESYGDVAPKFVKTIPGLQEKVQWPIEIRQDHTDPARTDEVSEIIIALNDSYGWSRERIADWLDTLDVDLTLGEL